MDESQYQLFSGYGLLIGTSFIGMKIGVYQKIYHEINRGRLYCNDSVSYCDIDTDLIDDALVDDVGKIAANFGYPKIPIYCDQRLDDQRFRTSLPVGI